MEANTAMKARAAFAAMFLMAGIGTASATVKIYDDPGGQIGIYLAKFRAIRSSGERVEIDGTCASACTMLLGALPRDRICVTSRARLVFHSAWDALGDRAVTADGNRILWANYPANVRQWITRHGGLRSETITLGWPELASMFPVCR